MLRNSLGRVGLRAVAALAGIALFGCADRPSVTAPELAARVSKDLSAPSPLVTVTTVAGSSLTFWPYTGDDFSGAPADPVNLVFFGQVDPRALRAALLSLDGDRSALPLPISAFDCTWHDVPEGNVQTAFGSASGWVGGVIQLACGDFGPVRFHLRLFALGSGTIGGAHFELQVPGTTDHQVLSWELAEALVGADVARTGVLGSNPTTSDLGNVSPVREIPAIIFNELPDVLRAMIGLPLPNQQDPVAVPNDGLASVFTVADGVDGQPLVAQQRFVIDFNQVIPKPFCAATPYDYVQVVGPVTLTQRVVLTPSGNYLSSFEALGQLALTPVNYAGGPYRAVVNEHHHAMLTDHVALAASFQMLIEIPEAGPLHGRLVTRVIVGPGQASFSDLTLRCAP
jgi:hypothetical protein